MKLIKGKNIQNGKLILEEYVYYYLISIFGKKELTFPNPFTLILYIICYLLVGIIYKRGITNFRFYFICNIYVNKFKIISVGITMGKWD